MVLFKSDSPESKRFEMIFREMSKAPVNVDNFALCDIKNPQNRQIISMANSSSTPITGSPFVIFYNNGSPAGKFSSVVKDRNNFASFIQQALRAIQEREESIASYQEQKAPMFAPQQPRGPPPKSPGMYGGVPGANAQRKMYNPEFGGMPSMKGALKGGISHGYQTLGMANEEDEITMLMPPEIVPHNAPWEAYKTMDNLSS